MAIVADGRRVREEHDGGERGTGTEAYLETAAMESEAQAFITRVPTGTSARELSLGHIKKRALEDGFAIEADADDRDWEGGPGWGVRARTAGRVEGWEGGGLADAIRSFVSLHVTPSKASFDQRLT